jgi:hypothetical protein
MFRRSSLFQFRNGDHTCLFYRSDIELMEFLTPFVIDGLQQGERVFCVQKPGILKHLIYDLRFLGMDTDREIARGALEVHSEEEIYFPNRRFEPEAMMGMLRHAIIDAKEKGFKAFRSAGELSWAVDGRDECDKVVGYEKLVDEYYPGQPAIGLCQYDVTKFSPEALQSVIDSHRLRVAESLAGSQHASIRVRNGDLNAEVVADKLAKKPRYYYVVQRREPSSVVGWGVASNFDTAMENVNKLGERHEGRLTREVGAV